MALASLPLKDLHQKDSLKTDPLEGYALDSRA
jgi:hypothetical protein